MYTPRDPRGWRGWLLVGGLWLGAAGCTVVGSWLLARWPDPRSSPDLPDQPMPSLLWQVGAGLTLAGAIAVFFAWKTSPALGTAPPGMSEAAERVVIIGLLSSIAVAAVASAMEAAAASSVYAWRPLLVVPLVIGVAIWSWVAMR